LPLPSQIRVTISSILLVPTRQGNAFTAGLILSNRERTLQRPPYRNPHPSR
jgi:hypothetical protein